MEITQISIVDWINKSWYIKIREYYRTEKMNEIQLYVSIFLNLNSIIFRIRNQLQNSKKAKQKYILFRDILINGKIIKKSNGIIITK